MAGTNHDHVRILQGEVYDLMVKKDCLWHQRSRVDWLKVGDLKTSYFHSRANYSNRKNYIPKLVLDNGVIIEEEKGIGEAFVGYFCSLFQYASTSNFDPFLQEIEPKVTNQMNAKLTWPFSALEAEQSLKQMKPLTAPGLDGMPPFFFKSYWSVVGNYVIEVALSVLNTSVMPSNINHTFISLIPKIKSPTNPKDFHPISLCNAIYKIISKTIANCLKKINPNLCPKLKCLHI